MSRPSLTVSRRLLLGASAALFAAGPGRAFAQAAEAARDAAMPQVSAGAIETARAVISGMMAAERMPSMSVAVWLPGGLTWTDAYGMADLKAHVAATAQGRYRFGSASKLVAAAVATRLYERGLVDLDIAVGYYRPSLPAHHRQTTLRQLLSHTGGVRHYIGRDYDPRAPGGPIDFRVYRTTEDALATFINDPLVSKPGEQFNYSTFGYTLMSAVLESATGRPFPDLLADEVTTPLGLATIAPERIETPGPDRVRCYDRHRETGEVLPSLPVNPAYKWAGGGMVGAADDLARFCGAFTGPGYLEADTLAAAFTPYPPTVGEAPVKVGLGWRIDQDRAGRMRVHHAGSIAGGRSIAMLLPEAGVAVVFLSNMGEFPIDPLSPAQQIAEAFLA